MSYTLRASKREYDNWKKAFHKKGSAKEKFDFRRIGLMDPSIGTSNMGDFIIQDAVKSNLRQLFPGSFVSTFPTQLSRKIDSVQLMQDQDVIFIGGTNLLASNMESRFQWKVTPVDRYFLPNKMVLFGTGWWQYQDKPNAYTQKLYTGLLSKSLLHSVRDSYSRDMLKSIGIDNVVNTSCPTLWNITPEHCKGIQTEKASDVITTLTFYNKDFGQDAAMIRMLQQHYEQVYVWIQGFEDMEYLHQLAPQMEKIVPVHPDLHFYDAILQKHNDIEYVGTRLHAGIRAIQHGKRALIVAVDNRAWEIGNDTNLNVIKREELDRALTFINQPFSTDIQLPTEEIALWRGQFTKTP
jgi:polysaccharide pyruvyl transferase WcaK-like protein